MSDYRPVTTQLGHRVFAGNDVIATCPSAEWAERIAAALNALEDSTDGQ